MCSSYARLPSCVVEPETSLLMQLKEVIVDLRLGELLVDSENRSVERAAHRWVEELCECRRCALLHDLHPLRYRVLAIGATDEVSCAKVAQCLKVQHL